MFMVFAWDLGAHSNLTMKKLLAYMRLPACSQSKTSYVYLEYEQSSWGLSMDLKTDINFL